MYAAKSNTVPAGLRHSAARAVFVSLGEHSRYADGAKEPRGLHRAQFQTYTKTRSKYINTHTDTST